MAVQHIRRHMLMWHHSPPQFTETPCSFDGPFAVKKAWQSTEAYKHLVEMFNCIYFMNA